MSPLWHRYWRHLDGYRWSIIAGDRSDNSDNIDNRADTTDLSTNGICLLSRISFLVPLCHADGTNSNQRQRHLCHICQWHQHHADVEFRVFRALTAHWDDETVSLRSLPVHRTNNETNYCLHTSFWPVLGDRYAKNQRFMSRFRSALAHSF